MPNFKVLDSHPEYSFIKTYLRYHNYSTDASLAFGELKAIQLLGHAMGFDAKHLIQPFAVFHNMYLLFVGESTTTRKTTTEDLGKRIYPQERMIANESSPEQFIVDLSEDSELLQQLPEFTALLKGVTGKGYLSRFVEVYNELHKCPERYRRKLRKRKEGENDFVITKGYLSIGSTVTEEMLRKYLNEELVDGGFLARWLIAVDEKPNPKSRERLRADVFQLHESLISHIEGLLKMRRDMSFEFSDEALERFNEIEKEAMSNKYARPFAGRYLNYVVSIADILLVSDAIGYSIDQGKSLAEWKELKELVGFYTIYIFNTIKTIIKYRNRIYRENPPNCSIVSIDYVNRAWAIVKPCLDYARELVQYVKLDRYTAKLRECIKKHKTIEHSDAMRSTGLNSKKMVECLQTLVQRKEVESASENVLRKGSGTITKNTYKWVGD